MCPAAPLAVARRYIISFLFTACLPPLSLSHSLNLTDSLSLLFARRQEHTPLNRTDGKGSKERRMGGSACDMSNGDALHSNSTKSSLACACMYSIGVQAQSAARHAPNVV